MFVDFFMALREAGVPVSLKEYLTLMEAMQKGVADHSVDDFYYLSRATLVKDERNLDRFDRVFGHVFRSEEHTSELQSLMRISYAVFCLKKKTQKKHIII